MWLSISDFGEMFEPTTLELLVDTGIEIFYKY
jgi:hypothetical protein